ncbi:glycerophosphodiester phosphodiesterase [Clostridium ljungdahlii]|uniref:glycerophosphodiester phosphodiesterase n=1 Tax=Clostridium ljungdahlii TaxID=1538 RepID=UPI00386F50C2
MFTVLLLKVMAVTFYYNTSSLSLKYLSNIRINKLNNINYKRKNKIPKKVNNAVMQNEPIVIAHRGANKFAPENSIPAIDIAGKMGYWGVELDVCSSSDGVLYLLHDPTLNRTTNGRGPITKKSSDEIDELKIDKGANIAQYPNLKVPRFEEALTECSKYNLVPIFEIKFLSRRNRDINTFLDIIHEYGYEKKVIVHSFNYQALEYLKSKDNEIRIMPIINPNSRLHGYMYAKSIGAVALDSRYDFLNKKIVQLAHKDGLKVFCWTIDRRQDFKRAAKMGVDYIYSDTIYPSKQEVKLRKNPV